MRIKIDILESIKQKQLKLLEQNFDQKLDTFFFVLLGIGFISIGIVFPGYSVIQFLKAGNQENIKPLLIFYSPIIFLGILSLYALISNNRLITFQGINEEVNRHLIAEILERKFNIPVTKEGGQVLRIYKRATFWKFGIRVIVIFNKSEVFINISRYNYKGLKSLFHPLFDAIKIRNIIKEFTNSINNTP